MMIELHKIVEQALKLSKKHGAQDAAVESYRAHSSQLSWRKGQIETLDHSATLELSIDLYVDGRYSNHTTNDLTPESLEDFVRHGIELTRLLEPDPHRGLPDPKRYENRSKVVLQNWDPKIEALTTTDLVAFCKACETAGYTHKDLPIFEISSSANMSISRTVCASSNGFLGEQQSSSCSISCSCTLDDGDGKKPSDYGYSRVRNLEDIASPESVATTAAQLARMLLKPKKLVSKQRSIVVLNRVVPELIGHFLAPLAGHAINSKRSYFIDKIGHHFGSELFSLHDRPFIPRAMNSRLFDGEGMSTVEADIFNKGILQKYLLNNYYARKLGLEANTAGYSNLVLPPGERSLEGLISDVSDGIFITELLGGNFDSTNGDFSYGITGVAIENGELTTPISEMTISGNYKDFWTRLSEAANDVNPNSRILTPSLRIDDVSVSGK